MSLYYKIWIDCLHIMKNKEGNWKVNSLIIMSVITTLNSLSCIIVLIGIWKLCIGNNLLKVSIGFIPFLLFVLLIFTFSFILHYFLIFYSNEYCNLIKVEDRNSNGLLSKYFIISMLIILFLYFIAKTLL